MCGGASAARGKGMWLIRRAAHGRARARMAGPLLLLVWSGLAQLVLSIERVEQRLELALLA